MLTGYARLKPWQARTALAILMLGTMFCVGVSLSPLWQGKAERERRGAGDVALYRAEADRIYQGEGYYQAAATELTARGYPTKSVFNWRTPLPMWLIGKLPQVEWAKFFLGVLALGLIVIAFEASARDKDSSTWVALLCVLLLSGPLLFAVLDNLFVMPVLWAGVLIGLSICAYGINRPILGVMLGIAALFVRELALPYCLLCTGMAWWHRGVKGKKGMKGEKDMKGVNISRKQELVGWALGLCAWLIFYGWHLWQVSGLITPNAVAHPHGWIQFGGAGFVLAAAQMNAYLLLLPPWVTALYFAASMFGLAGWNNLLGTRP